MKAQRYWWYYELETDLGNRWAPAIPRTQEEHDVIKFALPGPGSTASDHYWIGGSTNLNSADDFDLPIGFGYIHNYSGYHDIIILVA